MLDTKEFYTLDKKSLIKVQGKDKFSFLQGIISNDTDILKKKLPIYSAMLSPQGRFITDFFISNFNDDLLIEVEESNKDLLFKKLIIYKLRSDVQVSLLQNFTISLVSKDFGKDLLNNNNNFHYFDDPRFKNFLKRIYFFKNDKISILNNLGLKKITNKSFNDLRLKFSIPDYSVDAIQNKSLLMEMRFDEINGISWTKGCFMGQEITARMKYRNLMKKKLYKIEIDFKKEIKKEIKYNEKTIGEITSHNKKHGLAYFDLKFMTDYSGQCLLSGKSVIKPQKLWWSKS